MKKMITLIVWISLITLSNSWGQTANSVSTQEIKTESKQDTSFNTHISEVVTVRPNKEVYIKNSTEINGTTTTKVLVITGGADLAEPFPVVNQQATPPGAVVVIDEKNPGKLKISDKAYDTRVAGVVSGAGGVNPGLTLQQEGVLADGINVALTGRVYVFASTQNGQILPGDLLTTSDLAGHAMKATDKTKSFGTIVGKAMTSLENGEGLVLVLVNLQ